MNCTGDYAAIPATLDPFYSIYTDDGYEFPAVSVGRQIANGVTGVYLEIQRPEYRLPDGEMVKAAGIAVGLTMHEARSLLVLLSERLVQPQR